MTSEPRRFLSLLTDAAHGSERPYTARRLAHAPAKRRGVDARVLRVGDAVASALEELAGWTLRADRPVVF